MIREYPLSMRSDALLRDLTVLWEQSVRASHHFLTEDEIRALRPVVRDALTEMPSLFVLESDGRPLGMIGLSEARIEIFFLAPEAVGCGCGRKLFEAVRHLPGSAEISVNEENLQARLVYEHLGFRPVSRQPLDDQGAKHPILFLRSDLGENPYAGRDVRLARVDDLPKIEAIYESARAFMKESGNPDQWGETYPVKALLIEDIHQGELYIISGDSQKNQIDGVFMLSHRGEPTYETIEGAWTTGEDYGVIHRIASRPGARGILHTACDFASRLSPALRIDTHADNRVMQARILNEGFTRCGIIHLADGSPRIAYDRGNGRSLS